MTSESELAALRRRYARDVLAAVRLDDARIEEAFATVRREDYLGPGPWLAMRRRGAYDPTPDADPAHLYTDGLFAILPDRQLNNGQPSLHAHLLGQAAIAPGEHVVHIGTGAGYYTALMAELAGPEGRVTGIEYEPELASRARANLEDYAQAQVLHGDGTVLDFAAADVIYVNAGATAPLAHWLDRLKAGGRLILPLTADSAFAALDPGAPPTSIIGMGAVFRIARAADDYAAKLISAVAIFPCAGGRDEAAERALAAALKGGRVREVTRLYRHDLVPEAESWLCGPGWCLAYR